MVGRSLEEMRYHELSKEYKEYARNEAHASSTNVLSLGKEYEEYEQE